MGTGDYLKANQEQNPDLYWALSGRDGGTDGVVRLLTTRVYPDGVVSSFIVTVSTGTISQDIYRKVFAARCAALLLLVDTGTIVVWTLANAAFNSLPLTAPDIQ